MNSLWQMVGITPMIGLNDITTEVFDQQEAREVLAFAEQQGIGRLSFWSLNRDHQNANGVLNLRRPEVEQHPAVALRVLDDLRHVRRLTTGLLPIRPAEQPDAVAIGIGGVDLAKTLGVAGRMAQRRTRVEEASTQFGDVVHFERQADTLAGWVELRACQQGDARVAGFEQGVAVFDHPDQHAQAQHIAVPFEQPLPVRRSATRRNRVQGGCRVADLGS